LLLIKKYYSIKHQYLLGDINENLIGKLFWPAAKENIKNIIYGEVWKV